MAAEPILKSCTVAGHELAYLESGGGDVVLLVHGITTYSFLWRRVIPLLAPHYRVLAVDLLGCGASAKPLDEDYSLSRHADLLREMVDVLGIERFHLVGHDVGGGIAQIFAVRNTERLLDATLINSVGYDFWPVQPIVSMRTPILRQLMMATLDVGALKLVVRRGLYHKERLTPELTSLFWSPMRDRAGRKAFLHFARCLDNRHLLEIEESLRRISLPFLIIRGDGDVYLSSEISARLLRDIAGSRLVRIETGGHFIQEDEPEELAGLMLDFWKGKDDPNA